MKESFLKLASALNETGVETLFENVRTTEEFKICWNDFWEKHEALASEIRNWGKIFAGSKQEPLFSFAEDVEYPLEVAAIIRIINSEKVTEEQIFEDRDDLFNLLYDSQTDFARIIAVKLEKQLVNDVYCLEVE